MNPYMQPQIIILKEGTDQSQGKGQLVSNINACQAIVDTIKTTLGPRGMDKLMIDQRGFFFFFQKTKNKKIQIYYYSIEI